MAANICWARPEVTECWSYTGRLYMSYRKAEIQKNQALEVARLWPNSWHAKNAEQPIYKVKWEWSEA